VGGEIFRTCPDRPWGTPSLLYNGYRVFAGGKEQPKRDAVPSPPSSAVGHERVELYLFSPYGPYGLYRASVPVKVCTLLLPLPPSELPCILLVCHPHIYRLAPDPQLSVSCVATLHTSDCIYYCQAVRYFPNIDVILR